MSEKLQKVLARAGLGSRRKMETIIAEGRVSIDGKVVELGERVTEEQMIRVDGHIIKNKSADKEVCRILVYNKPEGEICTRSDEEGRKTVFERLPRLNGARWISIGRLDINTSGLLLFTTDGEFANKMMHPSQQVEREYAVRIFGDVDEAMLNRLRMGVKLDDGEAKFLSIKESGGEGINRWFHVVLTEGRTREVRRLWESQGVQVSRLMRVRYGNIHLEKQLPQGGWIELNLKEVNYLRKMVDMPKETETKVRVDVSKVKNTQSRIRRAVKKHNQHRKTGERRRNTSRTRN
ncbi:23S rRNA pseudouridine(2605) synthase RluB [Psychromonas antarctica]|jgi:23S rRNA pseudouridine2605 synthase|uniref:23S rRNA pseudouridine(2605) synthase RluB n=1 Tax=Psychromonas antarctica TaxID=67573 RepID=UPI001EE89F8C|nr:23S rRNA pseudouridine(2605) synthase RluB [Psychromonas antarctica]MCG6200316.1 23S rRNA pseudouridine(2605) synthase RluB [Psychromonas antarctica]